MSKNIIAFAGRMRSGKGLLTDVCVEYGYERLYFALPLKMICAEYLNISVDELNEMKNNNKQIDLNLTDASNFFSEKTEIPIDVVNKLFKDKIVKNVREMLQFIGTDLIRAFNEDWHVNKIAEMIDPNKKYVLEDLRFKNELEMVNRLKGDCWFVVRPQIDVLSHHISEESLSWKDMPEEKVIINETSKEYLKFRWSNFLENYEKADEARNFNLMRLHIQGWEGWINEKKNFDFSDELFISPWLFSYVKKEINEYNVEKFEIENNKLFIKYNTNITEVIENPLVIEDLKKDISNEKK